MAHCPGLAHLQHREVEGLDEEKDEILALRMFQQTLRPRRYEAVYKPPAILTAPQRTLGYL
jgi:hypothetical protein